MPRRIDVGRAVLIGGAALLIISLFTQWYDTGPTGWEVFESLDLVLAALALAAIVAAVRPDAVPPWAGWALPGAALVIVLVQILNSPPAAAGGDPSTGAWLALAGAFLMAAGSALSLTAISVILQVGERDVRRRVPAVDRRAEREAEVAEDLDADVGAGDELVVDDPGPATRGGRLGARKAPSSSRPGSGDQRQPPSSAASDPSGSGDTRKAPSSPAAANGPGTPARAGADDLERTQPLAGLTDPDAEDADRP
ncbi:MAG TPA: hypothetical protein VGM33_18190 [Baekduia sp.]|jgi:hypothetical protein